MRLRSRLLVSTYGARPGGEVVVSWPLLRSAPQEPRSGRVEAESARRCIASMEAAARRGLTRPRRRLTPSTLTAMTPTRPGCSAPVECAEPIRVARNAGDDASRLQRALSETADDFVWGALDSMNADFIESRCTEYGASEVDGSPSGTRFGGGKSESRTKAQPARCIFLALCRSTVARPRSGGREAPSPLSPRPTAPSA